MTMTPEMFPSSRQRRRHWKRGMGAVRKLGSHWYMRYCVHGKRLEEKLSAKTKDEAQAMLRDRLNKVDKGEFRAESLTVLVRDLYSLIQDDYALHEQHTADLPKRWKHLEPIFGHLKARDVDFAAIQAYAAQRKAEGAAAATVQREISCLRRMYRLGLKAKKLTMVPLFPQVEVDGLNARKGFFEDGDFRKVSAALQDHLRVLATVAYWTGARKGELLKLEWRHINLTTGKVELDATMVKNKRARSFFLPPEALEAVKLWRIVTETYQREHACTINSVFHFKGKPIKDFRSAWDHAFVVAGVERKLFHDLRRTSVRNYVRAGVPTSVCRSISGHRTNKVFDRYNLTTEEDQKAAAQAVARRVQKQRNGEAMGKKRLAVAQ